MLRTSGDGKKRALALAAFLGGILLLSTLASLAQRRPLPAVPPDEPPLPRMDPQKLAARRALLKEFRERGRDQDWKGAIAAIDRLCPEESDTCASPFTFSRMEAALRLGNVEQARQYLKSFTPRVQTEQSNSRAAQLALANDRAEYRQLVDGLLAKPIEQQTGISANDAAWSAVLWPEKSAQIEKVIALAKHGVAHPEREANTFFPNQRQDYLPEFLNTLGVALYRAGRDAEAIEKLMESENLLVNAVNWPFLALAHRRLGHAEEARRWSERYRKHMLDTFGQEEIGRVEKLLFLRELGELPSTPVKSHE